MEVRLLYPTAPRRLWQNGATALLSLAALAGIALFGATKTATPAVAQSIPGLPGSADNLALPGVTGKWTQAPVEQILQDILRGTGYTYQASPAIYEELRGVNNFTMVDTPLDYALHSLLSSLYRPYVKYRFVGKTLLIEPAQVDWLGLPLRTVHVKAVNTPLRDVLESMFKDTDAIFTLPDTINDRITVDTGGEVAFSVALKAVLKADSTTPLFYSAIPTLRYREVPHSASSSPLPRIVFDVPPRTVAIKQVPPSPDDDTRPSDPLPDERVSLKLNNVSLRTALENLFNGIHPNYSIAGEIRGTVTLSVDDMPLSEVIPLLLKQSAVPAVCHYHQGVIYIRAKK